MTPEAYLQSVVDLVPEGLPLRDQIAMELRSHIAERVAAGQPLDQVLAQLGNPLTLAESYLAAVPLQSARFLPRLAAKLIDCIAVAAIIGFATIGALSFGILAALPPEFKYFLPMVCMLGAILGFVGYTIAAEYKHGRTIGKRLMGIQVVRESGARISLGQSFLRQVPFFGQFFFIDAVFALFTERRQRAFELLTKTRAVVMVASVLMLGWTVDG